MRWSQLRVGLTVLFASIVLAALILLMTGEVGLFTPKIYLKAYFDNAEGLRVGAPVRLQGVDVGNVTKINIVPSRQLDPVEVIMKVSTRYSFSIRKDTVAAVSTSGVLGESYIELNSQLAKAAPAEDWDTLEARDRPTLEDVVRSSQSTLQNVQVLVQRLDRIVETIERGEGSAGKFINDPTLYNRITATAADFQKIVNDIDQGKGTLGKFLRDEELYTKVNSTVDKLNNIVDQIQAGEGTLGKFVKDPALYDNANQTIAKANQLMDDINQGKGALGKLARDEAFAQKLDATMTKVALIADRLEQGEGTAGRLLKDPSLYTNADQMLVEARSLVAAIRENPKKYLTIRFRIF